MNSWYQQKVSQIITEHIWPELDWIEEMGINGHRIDLGTRDYRYGIEIKSSISDLKSGYGLNQENFAYPYVVIPRRAVNHAIGYLYMEDYHRTGVICESEDGFFMAKAAKPSPEFVPVVECLFPCSDEIANKFYEHNAYLR